MAENGGGEAGVGHQGTTATNQQPAQSEVEQPAQSMESLFKDCIAGLFQSDKSIAEKSTEEEDAIKDLSERGIQLESILSHVKHLLEESSKRYSVEPDEYVHLCVLSQSLSTYLTMLESGEVEKLSRNIATDVAHWLSKLFNYDNALAYIHEHCWEGLVKVCRLALHTKYPKYATEGFTALYTRPPVVYISGASPAGFGQYLCSQLGLPQTSLCRVPCNSIYGSSHAMDVASFERLLSDDISCGKTPLLLVAYAGSPLVGHTDNISRLRELCTQNGLWFHLEGDTLATLALSSSPASMNSATTSDSMTLNLRRWFGLPAAPFCTFYRTSDHSLAQAAGLRYSVHSDYNLVLPLWIAMQFMGEQKLTQIIASAANLSQQMCHYLDNIPSIKRLSQPHHISSVVVFGYCAVSQTELSSDGQDDSDEDQESSGYPSPPSPLSPSPDVEDIHPALLDLFNKMIAEGLAKEVPQVALEVIDVPKQGKFLKFNPLKSARACRTTSDHVDELISCLKTHLSKLDNTVMGQVTLKAIVETKDNIHLVDIPDYAGVGMVQFVPQSLVGADLSKLNSSQKKEIDEINSAVLEHLSPENPVLSKGTTPEGRVCICIGMLSEATNIEELMNQALQHAAELEDSTKVLEEMNELIMEGIKKAQHDLSEEADQKLIEEGVLRHVPIVGSLFNWLSPLPETVGVKGRTFNLRKGHLDTTEKTYKYHMQIEEENAAAAAAASPASPAVPKTPQTPQSIPSSPVTDASPSLPTPDQSPQEPASSPVREEVPTETPVTEPEPETAEEQTEDQDSQETTEDISDNTETKTEDSPNPEIDQPSTQDDPVQPEPKPSEDEEPESTL